MKDARPELMSLFCGALERPSADQRAGYLDAACGEDRELRARVEALLRAHEQAGGFLRDTSEASDPRATASTGHRRCGEPPLQCVGAHHHPLARAGARGAAVCDRRPQEGGFP